MSAINRYARGALVRIEAVFTDADGAAIDPDTVAFKRRRPDATIETLAYDGSGIPVERSGVGAYAVQVPADQEGQHHYRWESTGNGQAAVNRAFKVDEDLFNE